MTHATTRPSRRTALLAGLGPLVLLAACGSQHAGSGTAASAAGSGAGSGAGTGAGNGTGSGTGTDSAGAARFADRAATVAQKLRAAGVPAAYSTGLVLLGERVTWPGFTDDLAKQGAMDGRGVLTLPTVTMPKTRTVTLPDGTTATLPLQTAAAAAGEAIPQPCGATERCSLSLDHASLTTRPMVTNRGTLDLPAWKFTGGGLDGALYVVAVAAADLGGVSAPDLGLPHDTRLAPAQSLGAVTDTSLGFVVGTGSCDTDLVPRVVEYADLVVVGGSIQPPSGACDAAMRLQSVTVPLTAPLRGRPVVDILSGTILLPTPHPLGTS